MIAAGSGTMSPRRGPGVFRVEPMSDVDDQPLPQFEQTSNDPWISRLVVAFLGSVGVIVAAGALLVSAMGGTVSTDVLMLGSAAIGGLSALLARAH